MNHRKIHMAELMFKCKNCKNRYESQTDLVDHMKTHEDVTFECHVCKKSFKRKLNLEEHIRLHKRDAKKYKCRICGLKFNYKCVLKAHRHVHMKAESMDHNKRENLHEINKGRRKYREKGKGLQVFMPIDIITYIV